MRRKYTHRKELSECHKLIRELWKEAQRTTDAQWGGAGMAPVHEVVLEFDKLRVGALKSRKVWDTAMSLEGMPNGDSGFNLLIPYVLLQEGRLIPYHLVGELEVPPDETIH